MSTVGGISADRPGGGGLAQPRADPAPRALAAAPRRTCTRRGGPSRCRRRRSRRRRAPGSPPGAITGTRRRRRLPRDHAAHTAEVVDVAVGVDHAGDRPVAAVLPVQRERGRGGLGRDQRVDHEHAGICQSGVKTISTFTSFRLSWRQSRHGASVPLLLFGLFVEPGQVGVVGGQVLLVIDAFIFAGRGRPRRSGAVLLICRELPPRRSWSGVRFPASRVRRHARWSGSRRRRPSS